MSGFRHTLAGPSYPPFFEGGKTEARGSRRKTATEPPPKASSNIQTDQDKNNLKDSPPGPGAGSHSGIKGESAKQAAEVARINLKRKPSLLTRAANAIKPSLRRRPDPHSTKQQPEEVLKKKSVSMNRARPGPPGPAQPNGNGMMHNNNIIDLTSDHEDDVCVLPRHDPERWATPQPRAFSNEASPQSMAEDQEDMHNPLMQAVWNQAPQGEMLANDEAYARALQDEYASEFHRFGPPGQLQPPAAPLLGGNQNNPNTTHLESLDKCLRTLEAVFPGICHDHVARLYETVSKSSERLIDHILSEGPYPRAKDKQMALKRKRQLDPDEEAARKYGAPDRVISQDLRSYIRDLLASEFPQVSVSSIDSTLADCGFKLFSAHQRLFEAVRKYNPHNPTYKRISRPRKVDLTLTDEEIDYYLARADADQDKVEFLKELQTARRIRRKEEARLAAESEAQRLEEENARQAEADGLVGECGCCYEQFPLNRLVHCNGELPHHFCRDCARRNAETEIGKSKYELHCMSMDACTGGFNLDQRSQFLDEKTRVALDRNEQEAVLRLAGIENLESCPFCPFAAEYPDIDVDREFRCQAPDCEKVSCRLCKEESHIPKSCDEYAIEKAKEKGLSERHRVEEAMSDALIRKCNKCDTSFIKEEGCNKMTCTKCNNIQCYVCSKSCDYKHFNDTSRGGKVGNCPLFENAEDRHREEVSKAEKEELKKILAEHPEYTEEDLKVKMSEKVMNHDLRRPKSHQRPILAGLARPVVFPAHRMMFHAPVAAHDRPGVLPAHRMLFHAPAAHEALQAGGALVEPRYVPIPVDLPVHVHRQPPHPDPFDEFVDFNAGPINHMLGDPLDAPREGVMYRVDDDGAVRGAPPPFLPPLPQADLVDNLEPNMLDDQQAEAAFLRNRLRRPPTRQEVIDHLESLRGEALVQNRLPHRVVVADHVAREFGQRLAALQNAEPRQIHQALEEVRNARPPPPELPQAAGYGLPGAGPRRIRQVLGVVENAEAYLVAEQAAVDFGLPGPRVRQRFEVVENAEPPPVELQAAAIMGEYERQQVLQRLAFLLGHQQDILAELPHEALMEILGRVEGAAQEDRLQDRLQVPVQAVMEPVDEVYLAVQNLIVGENQQGAVWPNFRQQVRDILNAHREVLLNGGAFEGQAHQDPVIRHEAVRHEAIPNANIRAAGRYNLRARRGRPRSHAISNHLGRIQENKEDGGAEGGGEAHT